MRGSKKITKLGSMQGLPFNAPNSKAPWGVSSLGLAAIISVTASPSFGQGAPGVGQQAPSVIEEQVVTGSRVVRDGYSAPTPTQVIGLEDIRMAAPQHLADLINEMPQMNNSTTPASSSGPGVGGGTSGANFLNMRGLGSNRTLTLLDGKRVVPAATTGIVDANTLPTGLAQRVEIVTGGASAAYGSGAVSGVINFVLDRTFTGLKGSASSYITQELDGESYNGDIAFGTPFADGKGHLLLSAQRSHQNGMTVGEANRRWEKHYKNFQNPNWTPGGNEARYFDVPWGGQSFAQPGGLIEGGPLNWTLFDHTGEPTKFNCGEFDRQFTCLGGFAHDSAPIWGFRGENSQQNYYGRLSYTLNDSLEVHTELSHGASESTNVSAPMWGQRFRIFNDNAYLPSSLDLMGVRSFMISRLNSDVSRPRGHNVRETTRFTVGIDGDLGSLFNGSGTWSAYYQYGLSEVLNEILANPRRDLYTLAIDAVRNPAVGGVPGLPPGAIICRSVLTNPTRLCEPLNVFGFNNMSDMSREYVVGKARQDIELRQDVVAISGQFDPITLPAGPVSVALGLEWREESYLAGADSVSEDNNWWLGNYKAGAGENKVMEYFVESVIPVFSGFDLNLALRTTDYTTGGEVTSWKSGGSWELNDQIRLRATRSVDIRAPSLNELFLGGQVNSGVTEDVAAGTGTSVPILTQTGGNPLLIPETSQTDTLGVVLSPDLVPGLVFSVDYFKIAIEDAITGVGSQAIINQCFGLNNVPRVSSVCGSINFATPGTLAGATIYTGGVNANEVTVSGYDFEASYSRNLGAGNLRVRYAGSLLTKYETNNFGNITDDLGTRAQPDFQSRVQASYRLGRSATSLIVNHIPALKHNNAEPGDNNSRVNNRVPAYYKVDLNQAFDVDFWGGNGQIYFSISNLLNVDPPVVANSRAGGPNTDTGLYDIMGRAFRLGIRFDM